MTIQLVKSVSNWFASTNISMYVYGIIKWLLTMFQGVNNVLLVCHNKWTKRNIWAYKPRFLGICLAISSSLLYNTRFRILALTGGLHRRLYNSSSPFYIHQEEYMREVLGHVLSHFKLATI